MKSDLWQAVNRKAEHCHFVYLPNSEAWVFPDEARQNGVDHEALAGLPWHNVKTTNPS